VHLFDARSGLRIAQIGDSIRAAVGAGKAPSEPPAALRSDDALRARMSSTLSKRARRAPDISHL
jgi:hypothetical protein